MPHSIRDLPLPIQLLEQDCRKMFDAHRGEFERVKRYWMHPFLMNGLLEYPVRSTSESWALLKGTGLHRRLRLSANRWKYIPWELCEVQYKLQFLMSGEKDLEEQVIRLTRKKLREINELLGHNQTNEEEEQD